MTTPSASSLAAAAPARQGIDQGTDGDRLTGPVAVLARVCWVAVVAFNVALSIASVPAYDTSLRRVVATSQGSQLPDFGGPLTQSVGPQGLEAIGLSLNFYAGWSVALSLLLLLVSIVTGAIVFWRKNDDRMALLASFALALFPTAINTDSIASLSARWTLSVQMLHFLGEVSFGLFFFLFPSGRFVPRWTRWLAVLMIVYWAGDIFLSDLLNASPAGKILSFLLFLGVIASGLAIQVYRYRHTSTPLERQQTKWVVLGLVVGLGGNLVEIVVVYVILPLFMNLEAPVFLLGNTFETLLALLFPVCIGIAILRSRLWDIDIIIRRTLVYSSLTALLVGIYFGTIVGAQDVRAETHRAVQWAPGDYCVVHPAHRRALQSAAPARSVFH